MNECLLSIIVPCYNASNYIDTCMKSIINNYVHGMEVIIINNGSTDDTLEKCQKYQELEYVTVISQENKGHCGSKNTGLDNAYGKYVMFIDVDDEFISGALNKVLVKIEEEKADVLCFGYRQSTEINGKVIKEKNYIPDASYACENQNEIFDKLFYGIFGIPVEAIQDWNSGKKLDRHKRFSSLWSHVYKREILDRIHLRLNADLFMYEDGMFNCRYFLECQKASVLQEPLYLYKKRDTGITVTKYDSAKVDLKLPLLIERNKFRSLLKKEKGIDILPWYAGSNVLSILQMCKNYAVMDNQQEGYTEWITYIERPEIQESIKIYPSGGGIKRGMPIALLKNKKYKLLFDVITFATKLGFSIKI